MQDVSESWLCPVCGCIWFYPYAVGAPQKCNCENENPKTFIPTNPVLLN
jgi:hypothetical protein